MQRTLEYALCDRGEAEKLEREQEVPIRSRIKTAGDSESIDHRVFIRNPDHGAVDARQSRQDWIARQTQGHAKVGKVCIRMSQCGQFPIHDCRKPRLRCNPDQVVDAKVAVPERNMAGIGRNGRG